MKNFIIVRVLAVVAGLLLMGSAAAGAAELGEKMADLDSQVKKKTKELANLQELHKIVEDEIGTIKAQIGQSGSSQAAKIGPNKDPGGFVTTAGGVTHGWSKHWVLDKQKLRKEYEAAGIYTPDEIDSIVEYHEAYVQNQGFTAECSENLAKLAECAAQKRAIEKYIERKQAEIRELELAGQGTTSDEVMGAGGGGSDGGGGGGGY